MGMYTELVLKCRVNDNIPEEVKSVLKYLFNHETPDVPSVLPDHDFFKCPRWSSIGSCSSFYHIHWASSKYDEEYGHLFSRSDLKDYDNEIDLFLDWLNPYIEGHRYVCIGWKWYEEDEAPTLIYRK